MKYFKTLENSKCLHMVFILTLSSTYKSSIDLCIHLTVLSSRHLFSYCMWPQVLCGIYNHHPLCQKNLIVLFASMCQKISGLVRYTRKDKPAKLLLKEFDFKLCFRSVKYVWCSNFSLKFRCKLGKFEPNLNFLKNFWQEEE